ncbi:MAG: transporter substrate-binding domain-containing protein [Treponema sp.]|jgi:PAS domain S-box-containing protein|nr:transporter substrate-binding domain-containing protein [Treponema sp.]
MKLIACKKNRIVGIISFFMTLLILFSACGKSDSEQPDGMFQYASFRDIPGVTETEIKAIEALREQFDHFAYGMIPSTESFYEDNGGLKGFAALFCEWLTGLFDIPFIPENYEFNDLLARLARNEVDFTGALTATEERRETYFMTTPIALHTVQLFRIAGSPSLESIAESRPLRYALMAGSTTIELVTSQLAPGTYQVVLSRDIDEVYRMLKSGEVDAAFNVNREIAFDVYGDVTASDFFPLIYTSASLATHNPELQPVISVMQKALDSGALRFLAELHNTGHQEYLKYSLSLQLSEKERLFIKEHPVVPFAAGAGSYPGSFYNSYEKQWQGFAFDILKEIETLTDLRFRLVNNENDDWYVVFKMLEDGKVSMLTELMYTKQREGYFLWSDTILSVNNPVLVSKSNFRNISLNEILYIKIGLIRNYAYSALFREWFPDHSNTMEYVNISAAINALDKGDIDVVMTNTNELMAFTHFQERTGYKINYMFDSPFRSTFGFNRNEEVLCSIVNKALRHINTDKITDQWMRKTFNYRSQKIQSQLPWLIGSSALLLSVLVLVGVLFVINSRAGKQMENLVKERTHELTLQTVKLQAIFDSLPDIVFCKDLDLRYTQCNKIAEEYNDFEETDVIGKNDLESGRFPLDVAERIMKADRDMFKERRKTVTEEILQYLNGVTRTMETIRTPLVQDGVMTGLVVISRDITDRKKVERELELQTAILTTLFDSIPDFIFTKDVNFCYMQCNKSYMAHLGFNREDVIGKNDIDGFKLDPKLVEEYWVWDRKVINEGRKFMIEERIPGADGTNPLYETVKAPLVLDGKIIGLLGIAHDITHRKEMEEAALAASRSKSVFLANMSHEIRTPMNSIVGFSELALDGEASPKTREYLAKIQTNADWLLQIINDILDISKIESGKMELENIPFDIHELFESCRVLIMPKAAEKGIKLQFYAEPSVGKRPLGDPTRLRQILVNLLSNAVKFTNSGTVKVLTEIKEKDEKTVTFHFEIKDSGIGMTDEQIKRIFEPFIQAETGTTRKYGGTGLGLSISKNFIELMGGRLVVESIPGIGSKFSFDLTFDTVDIIGYETFEHKAVLDEIEKPVFSGEVLLCEDNDMNQQVICEHLSRVGLKTVVAENGKIGVQEVQNRKEKGDKQYDLVFMDIHMPVMDGIEAAAKIIELGTGVPIVAMTANVMSSDMEIYKTSGMHDCIGKPFTSQELWRCLLKYLKPVSGASAAQKSPQAKDDYIDYDLEFKNALKKAFLKNSQVRFEEIKKALEDGDIKLAHRLVHTLKGNAGQIGKTALQQTAADVESRLKDGENLVTGEQMSLFEKELGAALSELAADFAPSDEPEPAPGETLDTDAARRLFDKLEPMLKMGNPESRKYIDSLRLIPGSETLVQQIDDFEFERALGTLGELKRNL